MKKWKKRLCVFLVALMAGITTFGIASCSLAGVFFEEDSISIDSQSGVSENESDVSASGGSQSTTSEDESQNDSSENISQGMMMPVAEVSVSNDYGFYYNQTLNNYYEHQGIDFTTTVGTEVYAVQSGILESIYRDDVLRGTEITINHGDGLKTVYRFVEVAENLKIGDRVERGAIIATVAEPAGDEYRDGAHLHFEVLKENESVDPATYLTFEEE